MRMFSYVKNCSLDTPIGPMVPEKPGLLSAVATAPLG